MIKETFLHSLPQLLLLYTTEQVDSTKQIFSHQWVQLLKLLPMVYVPQNEYKKIYIYIPNNLNKHKYLK